MNNLKLEALLTAIGANKEESDINIIDEVTAEINGAEYKIYTEDEANEAFEEYQGELLNELGIQAFSPWAQDYILNNFIETSWFGEAMKESYEIYVQDIKSEGDRLVEEMEQAGTETEEDYINYLCDQWESGLQWYKDNFGEENFARAVKDNGLIDESEVIKWVKDRDGRGTSLSSYDGVELEKNDYYIYRTN